MKQQVSRNLAKFASLLTVILMAGTTAVQAGNLIFPPDANPGEKTLQQWFTNYWRWYYTGADMAQSTVGKMQLMPLPSGEYISGSFTPEDPGLLRGSLSITLDTSTPFVLPAFAWTREKYLDDSVDPDFPDSLALASADPSLTIDEETVLSEANKAAYYVPVTAFDPLVVYPAPTDYGSVAAVSTQGVGIVAKALSEGVHVIHLYEPIIIPAGAYSGLPDGIGLIYDNTWTVTVQKQKK
jgi:hypothetical protein